MSAAPSPYSRQNNFVSDATNNPNITVAQIATPLDAEYDAIASTVNTTVSRLGEIQRDDGKLRSGIVFSQSLSTEVLNLLNIEQSQIRGLWSASTQYFQRDIVGYEGGTYLCAVDHTSGVDFAVAVTEGTWLTLQARPSNNAVRASRFTGNGSQTTFLLTDNTELNATNAFIDGVYQQKDSYSVSGSTVNFDTPPPNGSVIEITYGTIADLVGIAPLSVTGDKIANSAITTDKIADNSVVAAKIAAGSITNTKLATAAVDATKVVAGLFAEIAPVGSVIKSVFTKTTVPQAITAIIPVDTTIPQINEGAQVLSLSITPTSSSNKIRGRVAIQCAQSLAGQYVTAAVFRGSAVNAIASCGIHIAATGYNSVICFEFEDTPNALTQQTYTVRVGPNVVSTATVNVGFFGGTMGSSIILEEVKV